MALDFVMFVLRTLPMEEVDKLNNCPEYFS